MSLKISRYFQHGLLGSIGRELDSFGRSLQKEMDRAGNMVTNEWKKHDTGPVLVS